MIDRGTAMLLDKFFDKGSTFGKSRTDGDGKNSRAVECGLADSKCKDVFRNNHIVPDRTVNGISGRRGLRSNSYAIHARGQRMDADQNGRRINERRNRIIEIFEPGNHNPIGHNYFSLGRGLLE